MRLVRERARETCEYCLLPQASQESTFHLDHIQPRSANGKTRSANLALACVGCSLKKGSQVRVFDAETSQMVRLFHPRLDEWFDHFAWNDHWLIIGLTPIGRATILALDLNRTRLVTIRRELVRANRYPPDHARQ